MTAPIRRSDPGRARDAYTGPQIHCTHWRDQHELDRLHVAVIGSGAALARVVPPIVAQARRVTVFQHDPIWILPTPPVPGAGILLRQWPVDALGLLPSDSASPLPGDPARQDERGAGRQGDSIAPAGRGAEERSPTRAPREDGPPHPGAREVARGAPRPVLSALGFSGLGVSGLGVLRWCAQQALRRAAAANLRAQVGDSWERRQLTPDRPAAVRVHSRYYRALRQRNCRLISWPIARLAPLGIRTVDGVEHRVDCIIYAEDAS
ncbi:hypothetical protein ACFXPS_10970 [Nocardia sp. NPDC059091]|uniref:hypothetical protein n=1 Tax=unclassified Nocardia TaxID=2637762 RepID=UPI00369D1B16